MKKSKYVVTIQRQFGSLGRPIAMKAAELLGIEFYDRDIVNEAAKKLNLPTSEINAKEESAKEDVPTGIANPFAKMAFPFGVSSEVPAAYGQKSTPEQDRIFEAQKNIIKFLAEKDSCIIVGRCSDFILSDMDNVINIYIYAPYEVRLKNSIESLNLSEEDAKKTIAAVDKAREAYHLNYAGYKPNDERFKAMMIDSSFLGVDGTAELIAKIVQNKYGE